ncbi:MAG: hypothetical protein ACOYKZ_06815 [Chlamydiia bacterium]
MHLVRTCSTLLVLLVAGHLASSRSSHATGEISYSPAPASGGPVTPYSSAPATDYNPPATASPQQQMLDSCGIMKTLWPDLDETSCINRCPAVIASEHDPQSMQTASTLSELQVIKWCSLIRDCAQGSCPTLGTINSPTDLP